MEFTPASTPSIAAFLLIVVAVASAVPVAARHAHAGDSDHGRRAADIAIACVGAWILAVCIFVGSGVMAGLPLHGLPIFMGAVLAVGIGMGLSPLGGRIAANVPLFALVGFHAFRLPLELVIHSWAEQGTVPDVMTWGGQNFDVISGGLALVLAPFVIRGRVLAWVFNVVGLILLMNVIRVAVKSSPIPVGWGQHPPLLLALHLPYALIAPVCVAGALAGHIILTRALLRPVAT